MVKMLSVLVSAISVLVSTISNSQVFLLKKIRVAFANAKDSHLFSKNISIYAIFNNNSAEGVIAPAGAKVTGTKIRRLLNKFISFLAVLSWKTGTKCLVGHIYSRQVSFPLMAISLALTFCIIQPNDNGTST